MAQRNKSLRKHYLEIAKIRHPHVDAFICDPQKFHLIVRIRNLDKFHNEFTNGEYLLKLIPLDNYPHEPPRFIFLTPNGIYELGGPICISTGEFHKENFKSTGHLIGFIYDVLMAMLNYNELGGGIRIIENRTESAIKKYASKSKAYNKRNYSHNIKKLNALPMNKLYDIIANKIKPESFEKIIFEFLGIND